MLPIKIRAHRILFNISGVLFVFVLFYSFIPLEKPLFRDDYSTVVLDKNDDILAVYLNKREQWMFPPRPDTGIPEKLKTAVLNYEDKYFYMHPGINFVSLARALFRNITSMEVKSGASTITMQVARLSRPKERTVLNKLTEMLQAFKIELLFSKDQILRLYLEHAPYGGNIMGYRAASMKYFGKLPDKLSWSEASVLAVLPNAPGLVTPVLNNARLIEKRNSLLQILLSRGIINQETYSVSILEPVPGSTHPFPLHAPHLGQAMNARKPGKYIETSLEGSFQRDIKTIVTQNFNYLTQLGLENCAVLVAETKTGKVRAYIGSRDFFNEEIQGQVDGVTAERSTGSILKPFLYALCMDEGMILQDSIIKDVPSHFGLFSPSNASRSFDGLVTARNALIRSLNVPAVRLLNEYGLYKFYLFLKHAGMTTLFRTADDYGLPLIIGGAEGTVWDMAVLYRGLGNMGRFKPLTIYPDDDSSEMNESEPILITPGACYLTMEVMKELSRPGVEYFWDRYQSQWPLAWKTGTSYGQRDGWACGVSPDWTIAVWVGNFDGSMNPNLIGRSCSAPILFDIFNYLPKNPSQMWFPEPLQDLVQVKVCRETGYLAGPHCPETIYARAPLQMRSLAVCPYHKAAYVTNDEKYSVCSLCWKPGNYKKKNYLVYPPDVVQYMRGKGQLLDTVPRHFPGCPGTTDTNPLQILYPQENTHIWVPKDFSGQYQKVLLRVAHTDRDAIVYWYLDDEYMGETKKEHVMAVNLSRGSHALEIIDQDNHRDRHTFYADFRE
ncbi:MAG: penicillin-binding protein 1C [Spirochaetales bacterium]|nr:penicillin-binding protein 1C [Spirochaetales bacterium]